MAKKPPVALVPSQNVEKSRAKCRTMPGRNGGTLLVNGGRGPKKGAPNAGRPPSVIRDAYLRSFGKRLWVLEDVADGEPMVRVKDALGNETGMTRSASPGDRIKAVDTIGKYGLGTQTEVKGELEVRHVAITVRREA